MSGAVIVPGNVPAPLRTICRWCEVYEGRLTVLQEGVEPTSHGICSSCRDKHFGRGKDGAA